jgi:RIO-like serine/threonine protein kinase
MAKLNLDLILDLFIKKKTEWRVTKEYQDIFLEHDLADFYSVYNSQKLRYINLITWSPLCTVYKLPMSGKNYYIKKYTVPLYNRKFKTFVKKVQMLLGQSKAKSEWENLVWFHQQNIPAAKVVAYGRETRAWVSKKAVLITEELIDTTDLVEISENLPEKIQDRIWFKNVSHQVAQITRSLHQKNFIHNDLKWRNIMVDIKADFPKLFLIDCPSGQKFYWPFLQYRIIKDLACLDKRAKYNISNTQRLAFYKDYSQCKKLTAQHKKQIHKILKFFHNRE